ncbi:hypothetical protein CYLTODRAFT_459463 [Cylindrobasidium torrendii FP15055 ss-10]|uniref:NAD(P)-binding domain-containing protein n=1 Tax=Cylindrobasidium torrendii FP15055 ss-10 TaxID=1314674 RepID=A0A0D7AUL4_9AGAR|nr:hypothetical protein CYLTODRAFT_459463 [Cylindrobasidium torrendii FP15055 ss-10]
MRFEVHRPSFPSLLTNPPNQHHAVYRQQRLSFGASRNIVYYSAIRFLNQGATVHFLLRSTSIFDGNSEVRLFIQSGKAKLIQGDALKEADVKAAWDFALSTSPVDLVVFTIGAIPNISITKGIIMDIPNLVTQCYLNVVCTIPSCTSPKLVVISSCGLTKHGHKLLAAPHKDKLGMERAVAYSAGWSWDNADGDAADILGADWQARKVLPAPGVLKNILVLRPALFTDGPCVADSGKNGKAPYRVTIGEELRGWTISRKDAAHFISVAVTEKWDEYKDNIVNIRAY